MIAGLALLLLADASAPCAAPQGIRLGGGARLVLPVGELDAAPVIRLGPTTDIRTRPLGIQQVGASEPAPVNDSPPSADQCPRQGFPIA